MKFGAAIVMEEPALPPPSTQPFDIQTPPEPDTEAYSSDAPNPVKILAEEPVSTLSIDTDTASYSVIRSSLTNGQAPRRRRCGSRRW